MPCLPLSQGGQCAGGDIIAQHGNTYVGVYHDKSAFTTMWLDFRGLGTSSFQ